MSEDSVSRAIAEFLRPGSTAESSSAPPQQQQPTTSLEDRVAKLLASLGGISVFFRVVLATAIGDQEYRKRKPKRRRDVSASTFSSSLSSESKDDGRILESTIRSALQDSQESQRAAGSDGDPDDEDDDVHEDDDDQQRFEHARFGSATDLILRVSREVFSSQTGRAALRHSPSLLLDVDSPTSTSSSEPTAVGSDSVELDIIHGLTHQVTPVVLYTLQTLKDAFSIDKCPSSLRVFLALIRLMRHPGVEVVQLAAETIVAECSQHVRLIRTAY
jgi:hypothetical protein